MAEETNGAEGGQKVKWSDLKHPDVREPKDDVERKARGRG